MHASVGTSIRPWLIVTTATATAANASAGCVSQWATGSVRPPRSACLSLGGSKCLRRGAGKGPRCDADGGPGRSDAHEGDAALPRWGWARRRHGAAIRLGFWGDRRSVVAGARRGFLSELQNLKDEKENVPTGPVEFEAPLQIVLYPDPRLRNKNKRVTVFDERLEELVKEMFEVMYKTDGVGLAAPQVGVNVQLMLYNPEGERGKGEEYILVNPKIVKYGKQRDVFREGCLSFLKYEADVERPLSVRVEAQDIRGKKFGITLKQWQARIFQHEYDHLEGILFHDRMVPSEVDTIRAGLAQMEGEYERRTGRPAPEKVG